MNCSQFKSCLEVLLLSNEVKLCTKEEEEETLTFTYRCNNIARGAVSAANTITYIQSAITLITSRIIVLPKSRG